MTNQVVDRAAIGATYTPPDTHSAGRQDVRIVTNAPDGVARRVVERFALITFGLYHLPLFLNNYPSLGGGGFNDDGLAVRWGHVFTPIGVWVARQAFHMTGPMPSAYSGDNGDVGEEFGRLLVAIVIGVVVAAIWTYADRKRPRARWASEALQVMLRYSIALGLVSYGVAKLLPMQFPPLSPLALERRLGDLTPMALLWQFMDYSRPYAFFGGVMEMVAVLLLCFRRTATLGAIVCLAVMTNVMLLNYAYDVPVKLYATMIVVSAAVLVLYDAPRLLAIFVTNRSTTPATASPLHARISLRVRWAIKIVLVGSVILSSVVAMRPAIAGRDAAPSGLNGAWVVTSFARNGQSLDSSGDPARWRRLIVDGRSVAIRFETDEIVGCQGTTSAQPETISLACSRGRRGELRWTRTGDALQLDGTFDGAPVRASARVMNPSDYRLLRSRFHLITDR
jgi:uncharacterized membrane protein YphA (DoxX/SURF4 family)